MNVLYHSSLVFNVLLQAFLSLYEYGQTAGHTNLNAPAELSQQQKELFFISIHIIFKEKYPCKMFNINLQSLMIQPKFLILFTQLI